MVTINFILVTLLIISNLTFGVEGTVIFTSPIEGKLYPIGLDINVILSGLVTGDTATVTQNCGGTETTAILTADDNSSEFELQSTFYGSCTYSATIVGTSAQVAPVTITVGNPVYFLTPLNGDTATAFQRFLVQLDYYPRTSPSLVFDVQLNCSILGHTPIVNQVTGYPQSYSFIVPSNYYGSPCILSVLDTVSGYYAVDPVALNVIALSTAPYISSPLQTDLSSSGSSVVNTVSNLAAGYTVMATQNCSDIIVQNQLTSPSYTYTFTLPASYYGNCTYSATIDGSPTVPQPDPVSISVGIGVAFSVSSVPVDAGDSFWLQLSYVSDPTTSLPFNVELDCNLPGISPTVQSIVSYTNATYQVPSNFRGSTCILSILYTQPNYYDLRNQTIQVNELVGVASPSHNANLTIGVPFEVVIATSHPDANVGIGLLFTSGSATTSISALTNYQESIILDSSYFGVTSMAITADAPYCAPSPITLNFMYGLSFTYVPSEIVVNVATEIYLSTSATPSSPAPTTVDVYLTCSSTLIYTWNNVPLNQYTLLSALPSNAPAQSGCILSTAPDSTYYYQAQASVNIVLTPTTITTTTATTTSTSIITTSVTTTATDSTSTTATTTATIITTTEPTTTTATTTTTEPTTITISPTITTTTFTTTAISITTATIYIALPFGGSATPIPPENEAAVVMQFAIPSENQGLIAEELIANANN